MARATQEKWFADALLSFAQGYRSFEAYPFQGAATPAMQPGTLLDQAGAVVATNATAANARMVLLQSVPARAATDPAIFAVVLARDAEINDAYILYGAITGVNITAVTTALRDNSNIIMRQGVLSQSGVFAAAAEPPGGAGQMRAEDPPPEPVAAE